MHRTRSDYLPLGRKSQPLLGIFKCLSASGQIHLGGTAGITVGLRAKSGGCKTNKCNISFGRFLGIISKSAVGGHLGKHSSVDLAQPGRGTGKSGFTKLRVLSEDLTAMVDKVHAVNVVDLHFQQVFDKGPHQRLMEEIRSLGVGFKYEAG